MSLHDEINRLKYLATLPNDPMVACDPQSQRILNDLVGEFDKLIPPGMTLVQALRIASQLVAILIRMAPETHDRREITRSVCELIRLGATSNVEWM